MSRPEFSTPLRQEMKNALDRAVEKNPDPQARQVADMLMSPNGFATLFTVVILIFAFLFIVCSVIGGIAGATMFAPKNRAPCGVLPRPSARLFASDIIHFRFP